MRRSIGKAMAASAVAVFASMLLLASAPLAQGFVASPAGTVSALRQGNVLLARSGSIGAVVSSSRYLLIRPGVGDSILALAECRVPVPHALSRSCGGACTLILT